MAKRTLLELTQSVLSDISSDVINDIADTDEAEQVADIIRDTYWDIINEKTHKWEHLRELMPLESSGNTSKPVYLQLPNEVYNVFFLKYNKRKATDTRDKYSDVEYCTPDQFLDRTNSRNETEDNIIQVIDFSGIELNIRNDQAPSYYTTFDDKWFVFDSYDVAVETTLQASKTQCYVAKIPTWTHTNEAVPDLPPKAFSLLLSEAKSTAWNSLKQLPNAKEEQRSVRQRQELNINSHQINTGQKRRLYGRRPRK